MKKITKAILMIILIFTCLSTVVKAESAKTENQVTNQSTQETLKGESTSKLLEIQKHELTTIEDYKKEYGSDTYGVTAYILNKVRIFSWPLAVIGIAFSAIYQYVIGLKKLDVRDKGFNNMIAIITLFIICQLLPLIFAIVVTTTGTGN
mgnify:CR=1 FL=1